MPRITIEIPDHYYDFYRREAKLIGCKPKDLARRTLELAAEGGARGSNEDSVSECLRLAKEELRNKTQNTSGIGLPGAK